MKGKGTQRREGINIPEATMVSKLLDAWVAPLSASVAPPAPPVETVVPQQDAHDETLRRLFAKISSKESHGGERELYAFKKKNTLIWSSTRSKHKANTGFPTCKPPSVILKT